MRLRNIWCNVDPQAAIIKKEIECKEPVGEHETRFSIQPGLCLLRCFHILSLMN